jgi:hypothetical protein
MISRAIDQNGVAAVTVHFRPKRACMFIRNAAPVPSLLFGRVKLPESVGSGKVRCVGYGRKALALSVHPSGLGLIGRQIGRPL